MPGSESTTQTPGTGRLLGGRYRLVAPIARGGMAQVWEGHDEVLTRPVAVKVLQAHLAADGVFLERFRREAITAARLAHPCVVATFDTGVDDGTAFIVMELVRGRNLRQLLNDYGRLEPWQAVAVARQVADALAYAHQAGLVHRDIKPANILLVEDEWGGMRIKVTDFGIAKAGQEAGGDLTRTGMVLGTPKYLSPEQIRGKDPDARTDLYSLGVVLYEMLVGQPPFVGETDMATALAHLSEKVSKPSTMVRGIPGSLDRLVCDLLAKSPDKRVSSAAELRQRLDALGLGPTGPSGLSGRNGSKLGRRRGAEAAGAPDVVAPTTAVPAAPAPAPAPPPEATTALGADATRSFTPAPPPPPQWAPVPDRTSPGAPLPSPVPSGRHRARGERVVGIVVALLVLAGAIAAGVVLGTRAGHHGSSGTPPASPGGGNTAVGIGSVSVFMFNNRPPDNPSQTPLTFDGNPSTFWQTDHYHTPTFGNLYPGIGLAISLKSPAVLHSLSVTTATDGWSASVYVSSTNVPSGQLSGWGGAVDAKSGISGSTTFNLGGHKGQYVLLWITNLGPADQAQVAELSVH